MLQVAPIVGCDGQVSIRKRAAWRVQTRNTHLSVLFGVVFSFLRAVLCVPAPLPGVPMQGHSV